MPNVAVPRSVKGIDFKISDVETDWCRPLSVWTEFHSFNKGIVTDIRRRNLVKTGSLGLQSQSL